ncbi:MAG: YdjC family protein [Firmicutes bacterium]|nr:YdjC family protein [Bacillota bacterium]
MLKLIINADDLGLTPGCNAGIIQGMTKGLVTDTTLMINTDYAEDAVKLLQQHKLTRVGLHLNLTYGRPVLNAQEVPSLVDEQGLFRRKAAATVPLMEAEDINRELRAQVEKFLATGLELSHLDSHHHAHSYPKVLETAISLAKELNVPIRQTGLEVREKIKAAGVVTTDWFTTDFYEQGVSVENLQRIIADHDGGVLEIMSHPAKEDPMLSQVSSYNTCRFKELEVLTGQEMQTFIEKQGVQLVGFSALAKLV